MSLPNRGITGIFDPRLRTKDFPPSEPSAEGHFAGAAMSLMRDENTVTFASGTGDRSIEFWKTPTDASAVYIIEGATLELLANATQAGTPVDMEVSVEIERTPASGRWYTLLRARLKAAHFVSNTYDIDDAVSVWGMGGANVAGVDVTFTRENYVDAPHKHFDGRLVCRVDSGTDVLSTETGYLHGLGDTDKVLVSVGDFGAMPGSVAEDVIHFVRDRTDTTFKLALSAGGVALNITSNGTHPIYVHPLERGVRASRNGIYVGRMATNFRGSKVRVRGRTVSGSNAWTLEALAALQLRMVS